MSAQSQPLLLDANGRPIPQYYDVVSDTFKAITSPTLANVDAAALITHTAAAAGVSGADQLNVNGRGLQVGVNITAGTGTSPTLQVIIEGKDAASGVYYTLFASAAIAATPGFTALSVYPGLTGSATVGNQVLPRTWRVRTVIGGTTPAVTATVGASIIV